MALLQRHSVRVCCWGCMCTIKLCLATRVAAPFRPWPAARLCRGCWQADFSLFKIITLEMKKYWSANVCASVRVYVCVLGTCHVPPFVAQQLPLSEWAFPIAFALVSLQLKASIWTQLKYTAHTTLRIRPAAHITHTSRGAKRVGISRQLGNRTGSIYTTRRFFDFAVCPN